jgi:uncharacterized protein YecE (DUF72 family)
VAPRLASNPGAWGGALTKAGIILPSIRIGISGWRYAPWRGTFYPPGLPQRAELEYASRLFHAIEINGSFYSLQRPQSYAEWYRQTPADFRFAVKGGRYLTHMKKLRDIEQPLANFFASGLFNLRHKLGPVLWQFPPTFHYDRAKLASFFELLPHDAATARRLARKHASWMKGRVTLACSEPGEIRHAIEIRHESFVDSSFIDLLRDYRIALVIADTARRWPLLHDITAPFVYIRLHGDKELYRSGYGTRALDRWAERIRAWHAGSDPEDARRISPRATAATAARDVYCFFDNTDAKLRAPFDAQVLMKRLGLRPVVEQPLPGERPPARKVRMRSQGKGVLRGAKPRAALRP